MQTLFRNEIAGLRAVAVISVVLFHLKVGGFEGGFVGVDVFFVISGYSLPVTFCAICGPGSSLLEIFMFAEQGESIRL